MSFIADRVVMDGLTFDDILLIPAYFRGQPHTKIFQGCVFAYVSFQTNPLSLYHCEGCSY
mgnify:CR=1 FL=1